MKKKSEFKTDLENCVFCDFDNQVLERLYFQGIFIIYQELELPDNSNDSQGDLNGYS